MKRIIAVDFDGTIVDHKYPAIGKPVPLAIETLKDLINRGYSIILWTMRCDSESEGPVLTQAVEYLKENGVELWGINNNPEQHTWSQSPKAYAQLYIDDAAFGCPLLNNPGGRPIVDWSIVRKHFGIDN